MPVRVLVPIATGFEEIEAVTVIDVLRRAGAEVVVAGLTPGPIRASRGVRLMPDTSLDEAARESFDAVVLPGGAEGAKNLAEDARIGDLLGRTRADGRLIAAICAAPAVVLQPLGFLDGKRATCHPAFKSSLPAWTDERVLSDGGVMTSQAPGTAMEFALELVAQLFGAEKADEVRKPLVMLP